MRTCSTCSGLTPARSSAALMAKPPSSAALNGASAPLILPIGVRAPATMYEPTMTCPLDVHAVPATPCAVKRRTAHAGGDKRGQDGGDNLGRAAEMNVGAMASERDRASRFGPWEARAGHTRRPTSEPGATCTSLSQRLGPWEARAERTRRRERQRARRTGRPEADHGLEPGQHVVGAVDLVAAGPDHDATP